MSAPSNEVSRGGSGLRLVFLGLIALGLVAIWFLARGPQEPPKSGSTGTAISSQSGQSSPPWQGGNTGSARRDGPGKVDPDATPKIEAWLSDHFNLPDPELIDGLLEFMRRGDISLAEKTKALEHALNLIPDPEYQKLDEVIKDPAIPASMLATIFTDIHNRNEQAAIHASLLFLQRTEPEAAANGKALLAHLLDMDEESDTEAIRMQAETRLIELAEAKKDIDVVELPPDTPAPPPVLPEDPAEIPGVDPLPAPGTQE